MSARDRNCSSPRLPMGWDHHHYHCTADILPLVIRSRATIQIEATLPTTQSIQPGEHHALGLLAWRSASSPRGSAYHGGCSGSEAFLPASPGGRVRIHHKNRCMMYLTAPSTGRLGTHLQTATLHKKRRVDMPLHSNYKWLHLSQYGPLSPVGRIKKG